MGQKLVVVLFIVFSVSVKAESLKAKNPSAFQQCTQVGKMFGPGSERYDSILNDCFKVAVENARLNRKLYASALGGSLKVFAFKNIIFIQKASALSVISGEMSHLNEIESVALSGDAKTIAVLDRQDDSSGGFKKQILFFESSLNGNVAAFSVNNEADVQSARSVSFVSNDEILLSVQKRKEDKSLADVEIVSFKNSGDSRSPLKEKKPQKKSIVGAGSVPVLRSPSSVLAKGSDIVVLDENAGVQVISMEKSLPKVIWQVNPSDPVFKNLKNLNHVSYVPDKKMLLIFDSEGNFAQLTY